MEEIQKKKKRTQIPYQVLFPLKFHFTSLFCFYQKTQTQLFPVITIRLQIAPWEERRRGREFHILTKRCCSHLYIPTIRVQLHIPTSRVTGKSSSFHAYKRVPLNGQNVPILNHIHLIFSSNLFPFWQHSFQKP